MIGADEAARDHTVILLDHFICVGPNGKHDCLVLEPMGPSVGVSFGRSIAYRHIKSIGRRMLRALQYLHNSRLGVAHVDTNPGNLLLSLAQSIKSQSEGSNCMSTQARSRGKHDPCAPKFIHVDEPLTELCNDDVKLKLSDFGAGMYL